MIMLNQPFNGQLGEILIEKINSNIYDRLTILSAFAKNSGVLRLKPTLQEFKRNGGHIEAFIGIDAHGTSYEAVTNLLELCDTLYIVHSESPATTFHSKMYILSNDRRESWVAVGSNNLTGGGLWTNFESAIYFEIDDGDTAFADEVTALLDRYKDPEYSCSCLIGTQEDLDALFADDYLRREVTILFDRYQNQQAEGRDRQTRTRHFGVQTGVHIPRVPQRAAGPVIQNAGRRMEARAVMPITATDDTERMWFETRALTGGSRNILDLSKLGRLRQGSPVGTRYETDREDLPLGGVVFFDVDPENTDTEKSVTIHYGGIDYENCVIKFPSGALANGTWRIQLKGMSAAGQRIQSIEGTGWLQHKVLMFEKIRSDYYVMYVLDADQLEAMEEQSRFVATNGSAANSKKYGLL